MANCYDGPCRPVCEFLPRSIPSDSKRMKIVAFRAGFYSTPGLRRFFPAMGSGLFGCYDDVPERALTVAPMLWIFCGWARWVFGCSTRSLH
jgi:hypothetical protein